MDQRLWICSLLLINPQFQAHSHICGGSLQFVSYLIGNPDDRFCRDVAYKHVIISCNVSRKQINILKTPYNLICGFIFAYAKSRVFHNPAHKVKLGITGV